MRTFDFQSSTDAPEFPRGHIRGKVGMRYKIKNLLDSGTRFFFLETDDVNEKQSFIGMITRACRQYAPHLYAVSRGNYEYYGKVGVGIWIMEGERE